MDLYLTEDLRKMTGQKLQIDGKPFNIPAIKTGTEEKTKFVYLDKLEAFDEQSVILLCPFNPDTIFTNAVLANPNVEPVENIKVRFSFYAFDSEVGYVRLSSLLKEFRGNIAASGSVTFGYDSFVYDNGVLYNIREGYKKFIYKPTNPQNKYFNDATWYLALDILQAPDNPQNIFLPLTLQLRYIEGETEYSFTDK